MQFFAVPQSVPAFLRRHRRERACATCDAGGLESANAALPQRHPSWTSRFPDPEGRELAIPVLCWGANFLLRDMAYRVVTCHFVEEIDGRFVSPREVSCMFYWWRRPQRQTSAYSEIPILFLAVLDGYLGA